MGLIRLNELNRYNFHSLISNMLNNDRHYPHYRSSLGHLMIFFLEWKRVTKKCVNCCPGEERDKVNLSEGWIRMNNLGSWCPALAPTPPTWELQAHRKQAWWSHFPCWEFMNPWQHLWGRGVQHHLQLGEPGCGIPGFNIGKRQAQR